MKNNKFCQSCGMPMNKDPQKGGTEKDGSKSIKYCSYCYQNGKFTSPEIDTTQKMQTFCIKKMKEQGTVGQTKEQVNYINSVNSIYTSRR